MSLDFLLNHENKPESEQTNSLKPKPVKKTDSDKDFSSSKRSVGRPPGSKNLSTRLLEGLTDDLDPELSAKPLPLLKPVVTSVKSISPVEIHQLLGLYQFIHVFGKVLLNWTDDLPSFEGFVSWFAPTAPHLQELTQWYVQFFKFLDIGQSFDPIEVYAILSDYFEEFHDIWAKDLIEKDIWLVSGSVHLKMFQILVDDIMDEDAFRAYISDVKERTAGRLN